MSSDVQEYIESAGEEKQQLYRRLETIIKDLYPEVRSVMSSQIPTYRAKFGWIALGYWDEGVSLYTDGPQHVAEFRKAHPDVKSGKTHIDLKSGDDVSDADLSDVIRLAIEGADKPRPGRQNRR